MPIYEYRCKHCLQQFEEILLSTVNVPEYKTCPNCKKSAKRIPTAGSFRWGDQVNHPNEPDRVQEEAQKRKRRRSIT